MSAAAHCPSGFMKTGDLIARFAVVRSSSGSGSRLVSTIVCATHG